jgi:hypothetical protein
MKAAPAEGSELFETISRRVVDCVALGDVLEINSVHYVESTEAAVGMSTETEGLTGGAPKIKGRLPVPDCYDLRSFETIPKYDLIQQLRLL